MIDINITAVIQLVNFLVTLLVLNCLLIRPIRDIIRKRKEVSQGLSREINGFMAQAQERLAGYEAALAKARDEANTRRKQARADAELEEKSILTLAGKEAQASIQAQQSAVRAEADGVYKVLQEQVPTFADAALSRLLG